MAPARRCRAGLVHLIGRNKLDSVWLGAGPSHKLMTICNCCPCCCLWRMIPQLDPAIGAKVTRMPGVSVTVTDRCAGCGTCAAGICFCGCHPPGGRPRDHQRRVPGLRTVCRSLSERGDCVDDRWRWRTHLEHDCPLGVPGGFS